MASKNTPPVRRIILGRWLRSAREAAGMSTKEAGEAGGSSDAQVSRWENGLRAVRPADVGRLLDAYGVQDTRTRRRFEQLARSINQKNWFDQYSALLNERGYRDWLSLEQHAAWVRSYPVMIVPGLLQTEEYAQAVFAAGRPDADGPQIEELVAARMKRQKILTQAEPLKYRVVLDEAALRRSIGGRFTHRAQLQRLVDIAEGALPTVTLQVLRLSSGAHASLDGPFMMLGFEPEGSVDLVWLENRSSSLALDNEEDIREYPLVFDQLVMRAEAPLESRDLINEIIKEL